MQEHLFRVNGENTIYCYNCGMHFKKYNMKYISEKCEGTNWYEIKKLLLKYGKYSNAETLSEIEIRNLHIIFSNGVLLRDFCEQVLELTENIK